MGDISKNFSYHEFFRSATAEREGIDNTTNDVIIKVNLRELVTNVLQPLRDGLGKPLTINSGYRCKKLNELVGGVESSQHRKGQAADIRSDDATPYEIACKAVALGLRFDQMILYPSFVHFSYDPDKGGRQRKDIRYNKSYTGERLA